MIVIISCNINIIIINKISGFYAGPRTHFTDNVFYLKQLCEKAASHGMVLCLIFIDLHKAYDSVPLSKLCPVMHQAGINAAYITAVRNFYEGCVSQYC